MTTKTKLALAVLLTLGIASAAQAGSKDDADSTGGYKVGPMGQDFRGGANTGNSGAAFGYVIAPGSGKSHKRQTQERQ
jgi:hypothetical protein